MEHRNGRIGEKMGTEKQKNGDTTTLKLPHDATLGDVVRAINALAVAARTHSVELEGIRLAIHEQNTHIGMFCERIEATIKNRKGGEHG